MHHCEYFFLYFHDFALYTVSYEVGFSSNLSVLISVYRNTSQNEDPYYNGYLFAAQNQTRTQGINNTGNTLYGVGIAQNQPPLHYPVMLNPYQIYQNPVPGTSNLLQFESDRDSASPSPSESSN